MPPDPPDDGVPVDDGLDELVGRSRRPKRRGRSTTGSRPARLGRPVRGWRSSDELDDELDGPDDGKRPVYWRARDSLWFEPLVALAIIAVLLVGLFAFTANWPPVYVVESNSMQHGAGDHVGYLNAGDVVLAQRTSQQNIATYYSALPSGSPSTYGEPGNVILYYPNGSTGVTPVIHRALLYLEWDPSVMGFNASSLAQLPCSSSAHPYYYTPGTANGCGTNGLTGQLTLYNIGWKNLTLTITIASCLGSLGMHSGYLTLGDNNTEPDQVHLGSCAAAPISHLVEPGWIIGTAQGLLPWFGALKLFLDGNSGRVPGASWEFMGLSIAGLLLAGAGVHFLLRRLGVRSELRRREDARRERELAEDDEFGTAAPRSSVRSWRSPPPATDDEPAPPSRVPVDDRPRRHFGARMRSRRPHDRSTAEKDRPPDDDDL